MELFLASPQHPRKDKSVNPFEREEKEDERSFWDEMVSCQVDEQTMPADVESIVEVADALLKIRKERFPL